MKITVVPAQVTTVEDRVAGNLSFSQLILLILPIFGGSLLFAGLPPIMEASLYKIILICMFAAICSILAIRIKGKIILLWLIILFRYALRPRQYLFNKNSLDCREDYPEPPASKSADSKTAKEHIPAVLPKLGFKEKAYVFAVLDNPINRLEFNATKKGGLNVHINEIQK